MFDLGNHHRVVSTTSKEAQFWFDQGLNWSYAFNHEEGVACFLRALEHDPQCAMAHWGVAYASGPFYNLPWREFGQEELVKCTGLCRYHVQQALSKCDTGAGSEFALIRALSARFQAGHPVPQDEFDRWDDEYAQAMREVWLRFPDDADIAALFVEAMMTRTPWMLWNVKTDEPAENADTMECLEVLEYTIKRLERENLPVHPAILHLHIHVLEMSPYPEQALVSAEKLGTLCPEAGHLLHMPTHIHVLCGQYDRARDASVRAIEADRKYLSYAGYDNFYTTSCCHDWHMMMFSCMFLGQFLPAMEAADEMCAILTPDLIDAPDRPWMSAMLDAYYSTRIHVLVRFGRWQQIIDCPIPEPADLYCSSTAMQHYARAIAYANLGYRQEAWSESRAFHGTRMKIPPDRVYFNNEVSDVLDVAENMMKGELHYHQGDFEDAFRYLQASVERCDSLLYTEPWAWMHPPRHALGALLLEQGFPAEAEEVYRADLGLSKAVQRCSQHQGNIWSLLGLVECLDIRGESEELARVAGALEAAAALADPAITSSCFCRQPVGAGTGSCH